MRKIVILPEQVCADKIIIGVTDDEIIDSVEFEGGCDGNAIAVSRLLKNMLVEKAISLLSGVDCEGKGTSCPDQLAKGLEKNRKV